MNHLKRLGGHYLALILLVLLLILTLTWFYQFFLIHFGSVIALVMLALLLTGEIVLMMRGAVYTSRIHRMLREQADKAGHALFAEKEKPTLFKILDMDLHPIAIAVPEKTEISKVRLEIQKLLDTPKKRRGKQPRFPIEDIRAAVLEWEQRDPSFSIETLEDFLGRKFGYGPDGILLMSVSTFYDWRRRILKELDPHRPPANEAGPSSHPTLSQPSSRTPETSS